MIIAIDGYSATGKSTVSKLLAKKMGFIHIDSGAMYRAIAYYGLKNCKKKNSEIDIECLENSLDKISLTFKINSKNNNNEIYLNNENIENEIRTKSVSKIVSEIAKNPKIREKLVLIQRKLAENQSIVMDGRDIGSYVFPNADYKFFINSSIEVRTKRRLKEFNDKNIKSSYKEVLEDLALRDKNDIEREFSPLIKAKNSILIDNSNLNLEETLNKILEKINN